jgi:hypothetical protein
MFNLSFDNRLRAKCRRAMSLLAVILSTLAAVPAANASTYQFVIPTINIQNALTSAVTYGGDDPLLYGFYDVYIRPAATGDVVYGAAVGGNLLSSYTPESDISPITSGNDQWSAVSNATPSFDSPHINFRFTFATSDTLIALVTSNVNVAGKNIEGRTGERIPSIDTFQMIISSPSALISGQIRFIVSAYAYQFWDSAVSTQFGDTIQEKGSIWKGSFDATGGEVPEPASMFTFGGGAVILALYLRRRKRSPGSQSS